VGCDGVGTEKYSGTVQMKVKDLRATLATLSSLAYGEGQTLNSQRFVEVEDCRLICEVEYIDADEAPRCGVALRMWP
jgi:hypothetical protein